MRRSSRAASPHPRRADVPRIPDMRTRPAQELELLEEDARVFKLIGPVLVKQELLEVKTNVSKRIEYIKNDMSRLEKNLKKKQDEIDGVRAQISKLQKGE